ncbi:MAG: hypothetical protein WC856_02435 [Methylococcaceae bacterium]|jgi:hypothetical protein
MASPSFLGAPISVPKGATGPQVLQRDEADAEFTKKTGLVVSEAANGKQGVATLVGGTKVVSNTAITATSRIFLTSQSDGGTPGFLRISARTAGTSFTILSSSGTDTSVVAYEIFEPAA